MASGTVYCSPLCDDCIPGCKPFYLAPLPLERYQYPPPPPPTSVQSLVLITIATLCCSLVLIATCCMIFSKYSSFNKSRGQHPSLPSVIYIHEANSHTNPIEPARPITVNSKGLEMSFINSIPVCKYKKGDGVVESIKCSVCLYEFQEDDNLRILPYCVHAFHLTCIDTWLKLLTDCPLCRDRVDSYSPVASRLIEPMSNLDDGIPEEETSLSFVVEGDRDSAVQGINKPNSSRLDV
ncbi:hypothetical protein GIB67_005703 [Kingdonia uniflora]|uniref:RING-type E3 ubiquitin transferase n=1 Tax=Kingdonia uniflora TaxID=39325 RepID=A0A7J7NI42_9MAGN|nr:hypothetical protein GIB67_005703 [Kingdonia uniflora]